MLFGGVWGNVARLWGGLFAAMKGKTKDHRFQLCSPPSRSLLLLAQAVRITALPKEPGPRSPTKRALS
jgi:hypothetical protein